MYRPAAKCLFLGAALRGNSSGRILRYSNPRTVIRSSLFSTSADSQSFADQSSGQTQASNQFGSSSSSSSSTTWSSSSAAEEGPRHERQKPRIEYEEEQARVLQAALRHVGQLGWGEEAMIAGAREVGVSPSIVGSLPRKEAALVEFFMDECLQRLIDRVDSGTDLQNLIQSQRIAKLIRIRLEMQAPYISKWPQALSIQAHPLNVSTSFKQRAMLIDEIWHGAGDEASDIDWYVKRAVLGGIYSTTEIYMLTDSSPDFRDTWSFLDDRVKDAFDLKKTMQEAKYLAEAVGAGMGGTLQGYVNKLFQR